MNTTRIRHLMVVVAAAAGLFAVTPCDCTGIAPLRYVCGWLGIWGARRRGRRWWTGLGQDLLLGPLGVVVAWSYPIPESPFDPRANGGSGEG